MNDRLKKTLKHYVELEYYANEVDDEIVQLYDELGDFCDEVLDAHKSIGTKDIYNIIYKLLKDGIESFGNNLEERLNTEAENVKNKELDFLSKLYGPALVIGAIATSKILFAPIDNRDTVKQFVDRTKKNISRTYDNALRSGYLFGQSTQEIKKTIENNIKQVEKGMESGVTTAIPSFAKTTDRIIFLQNNKEVTWCSCLDGNECIVCGSLNGTKYPSVSMAPMTPHFGCRCILMPSEEITEPLPTYEEYLNDLPEEDQYKILGKNRYELWKNDGISLRKFINNGQKLRLDEIDLSLD